MAGPTLPVKAGISPATVNNIPDQWSATWFKRFVRDHLQNMDIRNAISGQGISITGTVKTPGTVSASTNVQALFNEPYLLAVPPSNAFLTQYRVIIPEAGVTTVTDGGALGDMTVGVAPNGIGPTQFRQSVGFSVVGNPNSPTANVSDIVSSGGSGDVLWNDGALQFSPLTKLGTVTVGVWQGSDITAAFGGTGLTSYTVGDLLYANGATSLTQLNDVAVGSYLRSGGVATAPAWSAITLPNAATLGDTWYASATGVISALAGNVTTTKLFLTQTGSGAASAAPVWAAIAAGDLPGSFGGFANPTAKVALAAVNGVATTAMRSDASPPIDQTIAPTWTGAHTFTPGSGTTTLNALASNPILINGANSGLGNALSVVGGFTGGGTLQLALFSDANNTNGVNVRFLGNGSNPAKTLRVSGGVLSVMNNAGSAAIAAIDDGGGVTFGNTPTGGSEGAGTVNVSGTGYYINGTLTDTGAANPATKIGLSVVNGSATTFMRSDGAPQLDVSIAPTWTGAHTFTPGSGVGITHNATSGNPAVFNGANNASGAALSIAGAFTGAGTTSLVQIADTGNTNGANLKITGNGASTPSKTIRVAGGIFQILNNAYSATVLAITDAGVGTFAGACLVNGSATGGVGYSTGAGGAVTQTGSRTTGVTLNKICGAITLFSTAGSATPQTFTVTNSQVAATDVVRVCQKSGTDLYQILVTAVAAGSFNITFFTTGGTTVEQPVFNFAIIKAVAA